jgi:hypothetical protein
MKAMKELWQEDVVELQKVKQIQSRPENFKMGVPGRK